MLFYFFTIKPFIYFNAMVYIARRKQANERKALVEMDRTEDATVDFPQNREDSMTNDLIAGGASDQGQSYPLIPDTPSSRGQNRKDLNSSFVDENDYDVPYSKLPRAYGDGELRLGTFLSLNEDIYSLGFASLLRNEIVNQALIKEEASAPKPSLTLS